MAEDRRTRITELLGAPPTSWWRAPGRVNLIGDHTDYCEGFVLPLAIDRECTVGVAPGPEPGRVLVRSLEVEGGASIATDGSDDPPRTEPTWARFASGVIQVLMERGVALPDLSLGISSTVPIGSGLSSSSALSVALLLALADAGDVTLEPRDAAQLALDAEVRATGVRGGLMDQLTSLLGVAGHALLIDCRSLDVRPIPVPPEITIVVVHSGQPRTLVGSEYSERREACEAAAAALGVRTLRDATLEQVRDDPLARHVVTENARVLAAASALHSGDTGTLGQLLLASHASLRDDYRVSTAALDALVDALMEAGSLGARLTGAGFGGCVVALAPPERAEEILATASSRYRTATGLVPTGFVVHAVDGAGRLER